MDRKKIAEAIRKQYNFSSTRDALIQSLKYLSDTNLLAFAIDLGIDTDAILAEVK